MALIPTQPPARLTIEESDRLLDAWEDYLSRLRAGIAVEDYSSVEPPAELEELNRPIAHERADRASGLLADLAVLEHQMVVLLAARHATQRYELAFGPAATSPVRAMQVFA